MTNPFKEFVNGLEPIESTPTGAADGLEAFETLAEFWRDYQRRVVQALFEDIDRKMLGDSDGEPGEDDDYES